MTYIERESVHPLCTCPPLYWRMLGANVPDLDACRSRSFLGIDPHPVVDPSRTPVDNPVDNRTNYGAAHVARTP